MSSFSNRSTVSKRVYYSELFSAERIRGLAFEKEFGKGLRSYKITYLILALLFLVSFLAFLLGYMFSWFTLFWLGYCICGVISGFFLGANRNGIRMLGFVLCILALLGSCVPFGFYPIGFAVSLTSKGFSFWTLCVLCSCIILLGLFFSPFFWEFTRILRCTVQVAGEVSDLFPSADGKGYYPVVEYVVDDLVWHTSLAMVVSEEDITIGSSVQVRCAADNPNISRTVVKGK